MMTIERFTGGGQFHLCMAATFVLAGILAFGSCASGAAPTRHAYHLSNANTSYDRGCGHIQSDRYRCSDDTPSRR